MPAAMIGESLGAYTVVRKLGAGGMGEVYLAEHRRIDRKAAIKVLLPELSGDATLLQRFFSEARATSSVKHPGIVEVFDCDVHDNGRAYIVMEYLEGESLGEALKRVERVPLPELIFIGAAAADALAAVHSRGIVHRDLKPDNLFLCRSAPDAFPTAVKILDFGIAKLIDVQNAPRTQSGIVLGTPVYMSPEQCRGTGAVDARTDLYSLGCILYQMACGRPPFVGESFAELIAAHLTAEPRPLGARVQGLPAALEALVTAMLAKAPAERPSSAAEVAAALRRLAPGDLPVVRERAPTPPPSPVLAEPLRRGTPPSYQTTLTGSSMAFESPPPASRRGLLVVGGVAAAAVLGAAVFWPRSPAPRPTPPAPAAPAVAPEVTLEITDAPPGLEVIRDGQPATLPLHLPRGPAVHTLVFEAPGYGPRTLTMDGTRDRTLMLSLPPLPKPAPAPPQPEEQRPKKRAHRAILDL